MEIKRSGSQPSGKGQPEYFTGSVRVDPLNQMNEPGCDLRARCLDCLAQPSARSDPGRHCGMWSGAKVG